MLSSRDIKKSCRLNVWKEARRKNCKSDLGDEELIFTLSHILVNGQAEVANDARDKPKKSKTAEGKVTKKKRRTQGREIKVINFTIILI